MLLQHYLFLFAFSALMASSLASSPISTSVSEAANPGTFVANVGDLLRPSITREEKFKLLGEKLTLGGVGETLAEDYEAWFALNENSGVITLRRRVDREELCAKAELCVIRLKIFLINQDTLVNVDVIIDDVNDNPPVFSFHRIVVNISEKSFVGDVISLDQFVAKDDDIGDNSVVTYSISANSYFDLLQNEGNSDRTGLKLRIKQLLDYETNPIIKLTLTARDHGTPPLSDSSELIIKVSDVNDNDPIFEQEEYEVDLQENLFPGYLIRRVVAHDKDSDDSGLIRYSLSSVKNNPQVLKLIGVDPVTGDVMLKDTLDREAQDSLEVFIEARDSSLTNQRVGSTRLRINIDDVNDNPPNIEIGFIFTDKDNTVYIPENTAIGKKVAHITANDPDSGDNGKVHIEIPSIKSDNQLFVDQKHNSNPAFNLTSEGFLSVNKFLDRERVDKYEAEIKACDHGSPKKCTSKFLSIVVLDENDHRPLLSPSRLTLNILENIEVGSVLKTIQATDRDALNQPGLIKTKNGKIEDSPYGEIYYHIIDGDGPFAIDPTTGELSLTRFLDREQKENYRITIRAKDGGREMALESNCTVDILIMDVNDNRPRFIEPKYNNITFYATTVRNHVIVKVQAVDYDLGDNGSVVYAITHEDGVRFSSPSLFQIDSKTGELRLNFSNSKLNDSLYHHEVVVQASDQGPNPLYSTRIIDVIITNLETLPVNDVINVKVTSPPAMFFVIISVTSCIVVLFIILIILIAKCRTDRKQSRTYSCGKDPALGEEDWALGSLKRMRSSSDSRAIGLHSTNDVEIIPIKKRCDSVLTRASNPLEGDKESTLPRKTSIATHHYSQPEIRLPILKYFHNTLERKYSVPLRNPVMTSSHDGDSGRGDSDPDTHFSDVTNDCESQKQLLVPLPNKVHPQRPRNPHCSEQCIRYGHSDACWMPNIPKNENHQEVLHPPWGVQGQASNASSPSFINFPRSRPQSRQFQLIHGSIPHRHAWNYPANDLSAIYSDVVMNTQLKPEPHFSLIQNNALHQDYVTDDVGPQRPLDQCLPTTIPNTSNSGSYTAPMGACSSLRRTPASKGTNKRLSASFLLSSSSPQAPLARSSSLDYLSSESLHFPPGVEFESSQPTDSRTTNKTDVGEVSMEETQEIIENIEKLLNS